MKKLNINFDYYDASVFFYEERIDSDDPSNEIIQLAKVQSSTAVEIIKKSKYQLYITWSFFGLGKLRLLFRLQI